jgi:hypothetical protein
MPRAGFEPVTPATKRPQTYALDRAATEIGKIACYPIQMYAYFKPIYISVCVQYAIDRFWMSSLLLEITKIGY